MVPFLWKWFSNKHGRKKQTKTSFACKLPTKVFIMTVKLPVSNYFPKSDQSFPNLLFKVVFRLSVMSKSFHFRCDLRPALRFSAILETKFLCEKAPLAHRYSFLVTLQPCFARAYSMHYESSMLSSVRPPHPVSCFEYKCN